MADRNEILLPGRVLFLGEGKGVGAIRCRLPAEVTVQGRVFACLHAVGRTLVETGMGDLQDSHRLTHFPRSTWHTPDSCALPPPEGMNRGYRMLTARATTSAPSAREPPASTIINSLAQGRTAAVSVGLKAVAVQNDSER